MRCLSLAQACQLAGNHVVFAQAETTTPLENRIRSAGMEIVRFELPPGGVEDAAWTTDVARDWRASWVVADGYHFEAQWQKQINSAQLRLLFFDDFGHAGHYHADYVLNQNLAPDPNWYRRCEPWTRLLLGTRYAQLRPQFLDWRKWQRHIPTVARKVLVTLGGADPDNATGKVLEALSRVGNLEARVVVGGSNPHLESLRISASRLSSSVRLEVDATNMPELMAWADLAVAAGGTTSWELAFMGLPSLVLILAENQRDIALKLAQAGVIRTLGWHAAVTPDQIATALDQLASNQVERQRLSQNGQQLVDGLGTQRIIRLLLHDGNAMRQQNRPRPSFSSS
jgi:UDP-2,4-diacetamido-2,4,6-trideoxy-beta-L-altropyranose hydrolase